MSSVAFPAGMSSAVMIGLETLVEMAPVAADYIEAEQVEELGALLTENEIPEELQPEAARQLAQDYGSSDSISWTYDSAKVERAADMLVRRDADQLRAREEILELFGFLNSDERGKAFDMAALRHILPRLAHDDKRRAVRLMSNVLAHDEDVKVQRAALNALSENFAYLESRDYLEVAPHLLKICTEERKEGSQDDIAMKRRASCIIVDEIVPRLEPPEVWHLAERAEKLRAYIERIHPFTRVLTAMASRMEEGDAPPWRCEVPQDHPQQVMEKVEELVFAPPSSHNSERRQVGSSPYFFESDIGGILSYRGDDGNRTFMRWILDDNLRIVGFKADEDNLWVLCRTTTSFKIEDPRKNARYRQVPLHDVHVPYKQTFSFSEGVGYDRTTRSADVLNLARHARKFSLEEQLIQAGFREEPDVPGIFRGKFTSTIDEEKMSKEVVVCIYDGDIWFMGIGSD